MGQEVKMDEPEGGVRPSVLYSLAEPLYNPRPRQGGRVPVHCVKEGNLKTDQSWSALILAAPRWAWTPLNHFLTLLLLMNISSIDISGCSTVRYYLVKSLFFNNLSPFSFYCFLCGADWDEWGVAVQKKYKTKAPETRQRQEALDERWRKRHRETDFCFLQSEIPCSMSDHFPAQDSTMWTWNWSPECCCSKQRSPGARTHRVLSSSKRRCDPVASSFAVLLSLQ